MGSQGMSIAQYGVLNERGNSHGRTLNKTVGESHASLLPANRYQ